MESIGFDKSESNHLPMSFFHSFPIVHCQPLSFADMLLAAAEINKNKNDEEKIHCNVIGWSSMDMDIEHNIDFRFGCLIAMMLSIRSDKNPNTLCTHSKWWKYSLLTSSVMSNQMAGIIDIKWKNLPINTSTWDTHISPTRTFTHTHTQKEKVFTEAWKFSSNQCFN